MNTLFFITLLFGLQILYWIVGKKGSKGLNTQTDYFLAGKNVRLFPLMMTFLATQVGGGLVLGAADEAYKFGWPVLLYPLGASLGLIALGAGIGKKLAQFQVTTIAEILEVVYGSLLLRRIASLLSIISLFMILVAQIIASHKFLVSLGFDYTPLFIIFWAIVILYTAQGGLKAVISTDMVQATFFSLIFIICLAFVIFSSPTISSDVLNQWNQFAPVSSKLWGWLLMPLLFMVIEQDMGQRCFAGGSPQIVSKASLLAGIGTMVICAVPVFLGSLAKTMGLEIPQGASVLMVIVEKTTNPWMMAFVGCAILAAIISTATSLINAISSNLSHDFQIAYFKENVRIGQIMTAVLSITAIFFAFFFDNIVDILIQSYDLSVSCLFVPIFFALFKRQGSFAAAFLSILLGAMGFLFFRLYPLGIPKEIASIILSLIGFGLGEIVVWIRKKVLVTDAAFEK